MRKKILKYLNDAREGFVLLTHTHPIFRENENSINSRFWGIFMGYVIAILSFAYRMYILHMGDIVSGGKVNRLKALVITLVLFALFFGLYEWLIRPHISFHKVDLNQSKQQKRYKIWLHLGIGLGGVALYFILTEFFEFYRDYIYFK